MRFLILRDMVVDDRRGKWGAQLGGCMRILADQRTKIRSWSWVLGTTSQPRKACDVVSSSWPAFRTIAAGTGLGTTTRAAGARAGTPTAAGTTTTQQTSRTAAFGRPEVAARAR